MGDLASVEDGPARRLRQILNEHACLLSQDNASTNLASLLELEQAPLDHRLSSCALILVMEVVVILLSPQGITPLEPSELDHVLVWQAAKEILQEELSAGTIFKCLTDAVSKPIRPDM